MRLGLYVAPLLVAAAVGCVRGDADAPPPASAEVVEAADSAPDDLAATGLYADVAAKALSPTVREFAPAYPLWSDGAEKLRWIELPDGATIDTSAPDDWRFPVGTKSWKEFRVGGRRVETRFWWKVREGKWLAAAYVWSADQRTATRGEGKTVVVGDRRWNVPTSDACSECHRGKKDRLLGFEAVSLGLDGAAGVTLAGLAAEGRLAPTPSSTRLAIADDGTGVAAPALGWLHANCGVGCHNGNANASGYPVGLRLRLEVADLTGRSPSEWTSRTSTLGVLAKSPDEPGQLRIAPGDPDASLLVARMSADGKARMPPLGTEVVDRAGLDAVRAWIAAQPRPADAPDGGAEPPADPEPADAGAD